MDEFKTTYGSWALIAGASEGLGASFAKSLASRGLHLILIARRKEKLESLASDLKKLYPVEIKYYAFDLADYKLLKSVFLSFQERIGLFIYNAAYAPISYFEDLSEDQLEKIVEVNIKTPLLLTKLLSVDMIKRKKGGIVLMSSLAGSQGSPKIATYAASKAFNTIFSEGIWKELKPYNIDVLASCAGAISTPGYRNVQGLKEAPGTLSANEVAENTLIALGKGPSVIPGFTNKLAQFFMTRILPRKWAISIMDKNTKKLS